MDTAFSDNPTCALVDRYIHPGGYLFCTNSILYNYSSKMFKETAQKRSVSRIVDAPNAQMAYFSGFLHRIFIQLFGLEDAQKLYPLVIQQFAIESHRNSGFTQLQNGGSFHSSGTVYQRVTIIYPIKSH